MNTKNINEKFIIIKERDMENIIIIMVNAIQQNGQKVRSMEKEKYIIMIKSYMMGILLMIKQKEMEHIIMRMEIIILENLKIIKQIIKKVFYMIKIKI